ncbi:MAG: dTDP-glucose 4,6-dehydratase [Candidatus Hydrogenedentota bacterium]
MGKKETILVTGGAGFIGTNFIKYVFKNYKDKYRIINLDALTYAGNRENLKEFEDTKDYRFVYGNIADEKIVEECIRDADYVINFAAETHVDRSIMEAGHFIQTDVYGVYVLLKTCLKFPVKRFIHISTDEVYGEAGDKQCNEDSPLRPKSPYAASKTGGDRLAYSFFTTYKLPVVITRCVNNFGPYQYPEKQIPLFITNSLEKKKMPVYGNGLNKREWIYVDDHCDAIMFLLEYKKDISGEVFNIGTGIERTILENANLIEKILKIKDNIEFVKDRPGHVIRHSVDCTKLKKLGWRASENSFFKDFENTVNWYIKNTKWWTKIKNKSKDYLEYYKKQYKAVP